MQIYNNSAGRIELVVHGLENGTPHRVDLRILGGWNDSVPVVSNEMECEELYDLRHLIDRAIAHIERAK